MPFKVIYDPNGATGAVPVDDNQYETDAPVPVEGTGGTLVRDGYTFANWNTAPDGSGFGCGGAGPTTCPMPSGGLTLYAQWFTTAGLTPDQNGNAGRTTHYQFWYDSALAQTAANPDGVEPDRTNALITACEDDLTIMQDWFAGVRLTSPKPMTVQVANLPGGARWLSDTGSGLLVTLMPGPSAGTSTLLYLLVCEITEAFMQAQGTGWFPAPPVNGGPSNEGNIGEGLSRFLGREFLAALGLGSPPSIYELAHLWLDSSIPPVGPYGSREDYVTQTLPDDSHPDPATGCAILFIYYLYTQLGFSIPRIVAAGGDTLAQVYANSDPAQTFGPFVQINNAGNVLAQDMTPGAPPATSVRVWDSQANDGNSTVATQGGPNKFDAVLGPASFSRAAGAAGSRYVTFPALTGAVTYLVTLPLLPVSPLNPFEHPDRREMDHSPRGRRGRRRSGRVRARRAGRRQFGPHVHLPGHRRSRPQGPVPDPPQLLLREPGRPASDLPAGGGAG